MSLEEDVDRYRTHEGGADAIGASKVVAVRVSVDERMHTSKVQNGERIFLRRVR